MKGNPKYSGILSRGTPAEVEYFRHISNRAKCIKMLKKGGKYTLLLAFLLDPRVAKAAEQGDVQQLAVGAAVVGARSYIPGSDDVVLAAAAGPITLGGAAALGTSVTWGGVAYVGASGAATVGGSVVFAAGLGYTIGDGVGSLEVGDRTIHDHIADATLPRMMFGNDNVNGFQNRFQSGLVRIGSWFD